MVRYIAWVVLCLVTGFALLFSLYIGRITRDIMVEKQQEFAALLAENLNHQIYRRFTLPTIIGFGEIALRQPVQYERLDEVVQSTIHGLHVESLRIYGHDNTISYSTNQDELGSSELAAQVLEATSNIDKPIFTISSTMSKWQAFLTYPLPPKTYILQTVYPLRIENRLNSSNEYGPIMGVLEFTQDITTDMERTFRFQQLVGVVTFLAASLIFLILMFFIRRAERMQTLQLQEEQRLVLELQQHENLASMGRVVASIAHEIRNPLGIIRSSAELLIKRNDQTSPGSKRILQAIYDESKRLSRTVSDFLDYARPQKHHQDIVEVNTLIDQALAFLENDMLEKDIQVLRTGLLDNPLRVLGDKDLLYRAFYNIMSNAVQAMQSSGILTIDQKKVTRHDSPFIMLRFQDSGPGFEPNSLPLLLDPFYTTKDDGTGLGLPIVNTIILSHDGTLELENAATQGAMVTVFLPEAPQTGN